jgi:hypothetical protein
VTACVSDDAALAAFRGTSQTVNATALPRTVVSLFISVPPRTSKCVLAVKIRSILAQVHEGHGGRVPFLPREVHASHQRRHIRAIHRHGHRHTHSAAYEALSGPHAMQGLLGSIILGWSRLNLGKEGTWPTRAVRRRESDRAAEEGIGGIGPLSAGAFFAAATPSGPDGIHCDALEHPQRGASPAQGNSSPLRVAISS